MKKIVLIALLGLLFLVLVPGLVEGDVGKHDKDWCDTISPKDRAGGLVPCGRDCNDPFTEDIDESKPCELCDFFVMLDRWIDRLLFMAIPVLAALMIAIGGGMYIISQGQPEMLARAKRLFTAVVIGLIIIYGAWLIVNTFLMVVGVAEWTGLKEGWWIIPCD